LILGVTFRLLFPLFLGKPGKDKCLSEETMVFLRKILLKKGEKDWKCLLTSRCEKALLQKTLIFN
jgi:hypothetical protein